MKPVAGSRPDGQEPRVDAGRKLTNFMEGFAAAVELKARAQQQGCFIESVCLSASIIDGLLRMGLILKHQLDTATDSLLDELLHQADDDAIVSEREMYRRSRDAGIVDRATFTELEAMYMERNRVVHRYVISRISTADVLDIAIRIDALEGRVSDQIGNLEEEQIRLGLGMTRLGKGAIERDVLDLAIRKHGNDELATAMRKNRESK
jgi:hypothetical protein